MILFDIDGTLAVPAQKACDEMIELLAELRKSYTIGTVGAAEKDKQEGQLHGDIIGKFDFVFSENGVHAFRDAVQIHSKSMSEHMGPENWATFEAGLEDILAENKAEAEGLLGLASPGTTFDGRGTFVQKRRCTVNVTPIGRTPALSKEERSAYDALDKEAGLRRKIVDAIHERFGPATPYQVVASVGGQIGLDLAPLGWDKTFCLRFVDEAEFDTVHFFGDKTGPGGGDYELFHHPRTVGHTVRSAEDTMRQVRELFFAAA